MSAIQKFFPLVVFSLAMVACVPPKVAHRDLIRVEAKIPVAEDRAKGDLCMTVHYEFSGRTSGKDAKYLTEKRICQSVEVKSGAVSFEARADFYLPYREVTVLGVEDIQFTTLTSDPNMEDYDLQTLYSGKLLSFKKIVGMLNVNLDFQLSKKSPVAKLAAIIDACNQHVSTSYVSFCIKWRISPQLAQACGQLLSSNEYDCLIQAAKQQGTYK
jgi:hypothetical protein